jgi:hypothetical protein
MLRRALVALVLLLWASRSTPAVAAPATPEPAAGPTAVLAGRGAEAQRAVLEEMARRRGPLVSPPVVATPPDAAAAVNATAVLRDRARRAAAEIRKAYYAGQAAAGVARSDAALGELADDLVLAGAFTELGEVLLWRAVVLVRAGRGADGRAQVARLIDLGVGLPKAGLLPPEVARVLEDGRRAAESRAVRRLRIETVPAGAEVVVNGRPVGKAPVDERLPAGEHDLVLTHPGFVRTVRRVDVSVGKSAELRTEIVLSPLAGLALAAALPAWVAAAPSLREPSLISAWARASGAKQVLVAERDGERLVVWRTDEKATRLAAVEVPLGGDAERDRAAILAVESMLFGNGAPPATATASAASAVTAAGKDAAPSAEKPVWKRWWLWTIVGVVVAGGVATGAALGATRTSGFRFSF